MSCREQNKHINKYRKRKQPLHNPYKRTTNSPQVYVMDRLIVSYSRMGMLVSQEKA